MDSKKLFICSEDFKVLKKEIMDCLSAVIEAKFSSFKQIIDSDKTELLSLIDEIRSIITNKKKIIPITIVSKTKPKYHVTKDGIKRGFCRLIEISSYYGISLATIHKLIKNPEHVKLSDEYVIKVVDTSSERRRLLDEKEPPIIDDLAESLE